MNKGLLAFGFIAVLVLGVAAVTGFWWIGAHNRFVRLDQETQAAWSQVENQYQRRNDLVPNLVETVKGYAAEEREVFEKVAEARAKIGSMQVTPEVLNNPDAFKKYQEAQGQLGLLVSRLLSVSENYPALKAQASFQELQAQLEGTENRIAVERMRFNDAVRGYNTAVQSFPGSVVAAHYEYKVKPYFETAPEARTAPKVKF